MNSFNGLERPDLVKVISALTNRVTALERLLQGQPIGTARIADLRWDKGRGGTLTLGGDGNGNGVLSLLDSGNVQKVLIDNTGILINDGNIIIQDENGITKIDSKGLVSSGNFGQGSATLAGLFTTTSSSADPITGMSLSITLPRANTRVLIDTELVGFVTTYGTGGEEGFVGIYIDGVFSKGIKLSGAFNTNAPNNVKSDYVGTMLIADLSAGAHTIDLRASRYTGGTLRVEEATLLYLVLGS